MDGSFTWAKAHIELMWQSPNAQGHRENQQPQKWNNKWSELPQATHILIFTAVLGVVVMTDVTDIVGRVFDDHPL